MIFFPFRVEVDKNQTPLEVSRLTDFELRESNLIFYKPLLCHCVKYDSFFQSVWYERKKWPVLNCVSPVLTQNQHIWNFHDSLTLNNLKLT